MKFIKFDNVIFETTNLVIFKSEKDEIHVKNRIISHRMAWDTEEERDAEFDRLEKLLIGE